MSDIKDSQPKNFTLNIIFIVIFTIALIDNVSETYLNHFKLNFSMLMAIIDLYLIYINTNELFQKIKYNKELKGFKQ